MIQLPCYEGERAASVFLFTVKLKKKKGQFIIFFIQQSSVQFIILVLSLVSKLWACNGRPQLRGGLSGTRLTGFSMQQPFCVQPAD